jgi:hypothetical protein
MIDQLGSIQDSNNERFRMSSCISHVCRLEKREKKKENCYKTIKIKEPRKCTLYAEIN